MLTLFIILTFVLILGLGVVGFALVMVLRDNEALRNDYKDQINEKMALQSSSATKSAAYRIAIRELEEKLANAHTSLSLLLGKEKGPFHDVSVEINLDGVTYQLEQRKKQKEEEVKS